MKKIHLIGIGGIGMSAIAGILLEQGYEVTGSDLKKTKITENLEKSGAKIVYEHRADNISDTLAEVIVSSAIGENNVEYIEALKKSIRIRPRAEKLAEIMNSKNALCVAGAHGKTTTTGMLYCILKEAGIKPSVMVGGILNNIQGNYKLDQGNYFVAEADESDQSFLMLSPYGTIITNIEDDHMENYGSMEKIINAFELFLSVTERKDLIALCIDNENVKKMSQVFPEALTYSLDDAEANFYSKNISYENIGIGGDIYHDDKLLGRLQLKIPGLHNLQNAIGATALAMKLGVSFDEVQSAFLNFHGVNRRFQIMLNEENFTVVDDYAHHPSEIRATLSAARQAHQGHITLIFQPHRYSRTQQFLSDFAQSFSLADKLLLLPVYSAGECQRTGATSLDIFQAMSPQDQSKTVLLDNFSQVEEYISDSLLENEQNNLIMTMGAGDVFLIAESLAKSGGQ